MTDEHISIAAPQLGAEERDRIETVLDSGIIADGPEVRGFEREFAGYCGADHGVATSNGTTALHAALHALGIGPGDRVLTTPFTFIATANAVTFTGADVGFVDIDPETYNIDPDALEARLRSGEQVDAVIAVHLYGLPADMTRLTELAETYDFLLVEDAAQAHGAEVNGQRVGSFGDAACFSFYPTKNMTTSEGGMITTNHADVAERAARFVDHGRVSGYEHGEVGHNFRMTSIAAAIGRAQLEKLPDFTTARQRNAAALTEYLEDAPVTTPVTPPGRTHVFHQYTVQCDDVGRDALKSYLDANNIGTGVYYPKPVHEQAPYKHLSVSAPVAESVAKRVLSLPVHPGLSAEDVERVGKTVTNYLEVTT
ncbi:aminotransferase class V-fold PLP-dependent enzyme [Haloferax sp. MBLA0076]|uniref:Aminotransferase class V-fold PLP-dependent enzyme n=1 Tax=Haloferax litoreum TaxID=2666140 RepID=A0A6A8GKR0_9EURY|nr:MULTISPECIES: DegT/DnrJ/EryC1/StrS family aminotransferase [Haloferax]KAB1189954.1 DegT/DnrJ/EryC1/StrS family aminotransferase [Haloferax sp. CBA1148]MRX23725.1 aminotransferase class V-fold PLP-dependent enzyme [Haloferax litoreum]